MITTIKQLQKIIHSGSNLLIIKDASGPDYSLLIFQPSAGFTMEAVKGSFMEKLKKNLIVFPSTSYFINLTRLTELAG